MRNWIVALSLLVSLILAQPVVFAADGQVPLNLSPVTNFLMPTVGVPTGSVVWNGTTYRLDSRVYHSRDAALGWYPDDLSLNMPGDAESASAVQILINLDGATSDFDGRKVGEVILTWGNGSQQTIDLIAGVNVRSWLLPASSATTAPGALADVGSDEVWRGTDVYGRSAVIDSLTVVADPSVSASGLTHVAIRDTSFETVGALDPGLIVRAVTVRTVQPGD